MQINWCTLDFVIDPDASVSFKVKTVLVCGSPNVKIDNKVHHNASSDNFCSLLFPNAMLL